MIANLYSFLTPGEFFLIRLFFLGGFNEDDIERFEKLFSTPEGNVSIKNVEGYFDKVYSPMDAIENICGFSIPYKEMSIEQRQSIIKDNDGKSVSFLCDYIGEVEYESMLNAAFIFRMLELEGFANEMARVAGRGVIAKGLEKVKAKINVRKEISAINRKNASGHKNKNHDFAILIMKLTWESYPNTTKNAMKTRILEHFNGGISEASLNRWIKEEAFGPKERVIPCPPFKLIIPS